MVLGSTVEGFDIHPGERVWIPSLVTIPQPAFQRKTDTNELVRTEQPPKTTFEPKQIIIYERADVPNPCWRRHRECWTHCQQINTKDK